MVTINANLETTKLEYAKAIQGMRSPTVVTLRKDTSLFRFASTKNPLTGQVVESTARVKGAWWFQEADYRKIVDRFHSAHLALGTVATSAGAVQPTWSLMDVLIEARLAEDVNVYVGNGSTQFRAELPNGMYMTLPGWPDIVQVYIPDIHGAAFRAIRVLREEIIASDNFRFLAGKR